MFPGIPIQEPPASSTSEARPSNNASNTTNTSASNSAAGNTNTVSSGGSMRAGAEFGGASGGVPGPVAVPRPGHSRNSSLDMRPNPPQLVGQGLCYYLRFYLVSYIMNAFFFSYTFDSYSNGLTQDYKCIYG